MIKDKIFVFGARGHAKVVIDIIEKQGLYEISFLVDDDPALKGTEIYGYSVLGGKDELMKHRETLSGCVVAIGSNEARTAIAAWLCENGFDLISAVHPTAVLARGVTLGKGSVIIAGAVINSDTKIGDNVIINTNANIDHDCVLGDGVHVAPGSTLCGTVSVGRNTFIGAGSTIIPNITIGHHSIIGAGSTVIDDVPDRVLVVGSPARIVRHL